jgi:diguanylate cyclase (GGDEF)-like protein
LFYLLLTAGLALPIIAALVVNLKGHYKPAATLTVLAAMAGPWLCLLADNTIVHGDVMPLVYLALSIELSAILLTERVTLAVSLLQFGGLIAFIAVNPGMPHVNWPSLVAFIVFVATLGIVSSVLSRRQMEQIERDRSLLQQSEERLQALAVRDSLSGLFNRRYMEETLEREISRALREKRCLGVIMADMDGFKLINDSFGHALGDAVLCRVANILARHTRKSDVVCRFGGDEFILILPECALEDAVLRAQSLRRMVEEASFLFDSADVGRVTLSMGVSALPEHGAEAADLLRAADRALYIAKRDGRNRVVTARIPQAHDGTQTKKS